MTKIQNKDQAITQNFNFKTCTPHHPQYQNNKNIINNDK